MVRQSRIVMGFCLVVGGRVLGVDLAHGVARGWWGMQVAPADVEGEGLLSVSLETYSAMRVVEETLGPGHLRRYLGLMSSGQTWV